MGNCIGHRRSSATTWCGEEWGSDEETETEALSQCGEMERLLGGGSGAEVKIKISKKQLEELVVRAEKKGMPIEKVIAQLMEMKGEFQVRHRQWRPELHSIPELD